METALLNKARKSCLIKILVHRKNNQVFISRIIYKISSKGMSPNVTSTEKDSTTTLKSRATSNRLRTHRKPAITVAITIQRKICLYPVIVGGTPSLCRRRGRVIRRIKILIVLWARSLPTILKPNLTLSQGHLDH